MSALQFLSNTFGQVVLLAAAAWLIRKLFENQFARDAEKFRSQLTRDAASFQNNLAIEAHRENTRFSRLHEQRALVIAEVYGLFVKAERAVGDMVKVFQFSGEPSHLEKANNSAHALTDLQGRWDAARIWFTEDTCKKADAVMEELRAIHNRFNIFVLDLSTGKPRSQASEQWHQMSERVNKVTVPPLKKALEDDFRSMLGVDKYQAPVDSVK